MHSTGQHLVVYVLVRDPLPRHCHRNVMQQWMSGPCIAQEPAHSLIHSLFLCVVADETCAILLWEEEQVM